MSRSIEKLHSALIDTVRGYEAAERDADKPELKAFFGEMVVLRCQDHEEIHRALADTGVQLDDRASVMENLYAAAVSIRAAITGLDQSAIAPFVGGEEHILELYEYAIMHGDPTTDALLRQQRDRLRKQVDRMRALEK